VDIQLFLNERIEFILRQLYRTASEPYVECKRTIEAEEDPFVPPYSEDGEPPFLEEWLEADGPSTCSPTRASQCLQRRYISTWKRG
jgi:hypothetical protein